MENIYSETVETTVDKTTKPFFFDIKAKLPKIIMGSVVASALVGIIAMITGSWGLLQGQLILTILMSLGFCLVSWYDTTVSYKRSESFGITSFFITAILLFFGLFQIWINPMIMTTVNTWMRNDQANAVMGSVIAWGFICIIIRFALAHTHLLLFLKEKFNNSSINLVIKGTIAVLTVVALMLIIPIMTPLYNIIITDEIYWRAFGVLVILNILGTILIPITYGLFFKEKTPKPVHQGYTGYPQVPNGQQPYYPQQGQYPYPVNQQQPTHPGYAPQQQYQGVPNPGYTPAPNQPQPYPQWSPNNQTQTPQGHVQQGYPMNPPVQQQQYPHPNFAPPTGNPVDPTVMSNNPYDVQQSVNPQPVPQVNNSTVEQPPVLGLQQTETTQDVIPEPPVDQPKPE